MTLILILYRYEIYDQGFLYRENRIVIKVLAPSIEDLRGDRLIALGKRLQRDISPVRYARRVGARRSSTYDKMDVRWPERVPVHQLQQLAARAVGRHGIRRWFDAVERVLAIWIREKLAAEVVLDLLVVLLLVEALEMTLASIHVTGCGTLCLTVRRSLPHIDADVGKWLLCYRVKNFAVHVHSLCRGN